MLNWQNILVGLIVVAAVLYVARRGLERLRSFRASRGGSGGAACATACGSCNESQKPSDTPRTVFVEIGRSPRLPRRDAL